MSDHPESRHLLDFVARLGETDEGGLFRHLLSCPACSKVALELIENQRRGLDWGNVLSFHPVVDRAASRLEAVWRERWSDAEADRLGCEARLAELLAAPAGRRAELLARDGRLRVWAVADRALDTAAGSLAEEPRRALEIARVGLQVTASLDAGFYGERLLADLELRALALVGEAHRRLGDLDAAEASFEQARGPLGMGVDPAEIAQHDHLLALLLRSRGRLDEACSLFARSAATWLELGDGPRAARPLCSRAITALLKGQPEVAVGLLREALARLGTDGDPATELSVRYHLLLALVELGRFPEAQRQCRELASSADPALGRDPRLLWLRSELARAIGNPREAEELRAELPESWRRLPASPAERARRLVMDDPVS